MRQSIIKWVTSRNINLLRVRKETKSQSKCQPFTSVGSNRGLSFESHNQDSCAGPYDWWGFQETPHLMLLFCRSLDFTTKIQVFNNILLCGLLSSAIDHGQPWQFTLHPSGLWFYVKGWRNRKSRYILVIFDTQKMKLKDPGTLRAFIFFLEEKNLSTKFVNKSVAFHNQIVCFSEQTSRNCLNS